MTDIDAITHFSYFPGCSLATSAKENNQSLINFCQRIGITLTPLEDWNCCGSSSAHSINGPLAMELALRNLALIPRGSPLLAACPSCFLRLRETHMKLLRNPSLQKAFHEKWRKPYPTDLLLISFFDLLAMRNLRKTLGPSSGNLLRGIRFVPYYGCMLMMPPAFKADAFKNMGIMENMLRSLGAEPISWGYASRCCGTYLSVAKPEVITPIVNEIVTHAMDSGAECIVTACAMCHLNIEVRCQLPRPIPVFHFSELLSLALGEKKTSTWFARHLVDPRPLLAKRELLR